jgi:hypothetical protein
MQVKVNVTKQDIKNGVVGGVDSCPIALALNRSGYLDVTVAGEIHSYDHNMVAKHTKRSLNFVSKFDKCKSSVKPCSFTFNFKWV